MFDIIREISSVTRLDPRLLGKSHHNEIRLQGTSEIMTSIINVTAVDCKVLFQVINYNDFTYIRKNVSKKNK